MHLSSICSLIAKGLNTYVNKVSVFFTFNTFAKMSKTCFPVVIMGYCVCICHALALVFCVFFIIVVRPGCDMGDYVFVLSRGFVD